RGAHLPNLLPRGGRARKSEIALRLSLGASRGRIIRQLVTESLTLAALGGVAGIVVADAIYGALVGMLEESDPSFQMRFGLDPVVLGFLVAATIAAALLFGAFPRGRASRARAG